MSTESNKQNVPKIRFPGFKEPWEQRKLGDVASFRKGHGYSKNDLCTEGESIILYGRLYTDYSPAITKVDTYVKPKNGTIYSQGGEVIIPASGETAEDIARASAVLSKGIILGGDLNIIQPNSEIDPVFLALQLTMGDQKKELSSKAQGKSVVHIHNSDLEKVSIRYPDLLEQFKIRNFACEFDELITLHQRELDDLKKLKKGLLQKMFPKPGKQIPEIRFPEFTEPWEQRKLSELTNRLIQKNKNLESELPLTISAQFGLVDQETFFNKRVASKDLRNYLLVNNGEFAYNKSYSAGYPWGTVKRLDRYPKGVVSSLYVVFSPIPEEIDSCFLVTFFESDLWYPEIAKRAAEGARNHGLLNIPSSDFFDMKITIPSLSEQQQIGKFFASFDNLITLHQQQLDNLKVLKSGLLQQMFV